MDATNQIIESENFSILEFNVAYSEVDSMKFLHHSNHLRYYEAGRMELMKKKGIDYKSMEDQGIFMPVISCNINYVKPAFFDDLVILKTELVNISGVKVFFEHTLYKQIDKEQMILSKGETILTFIDSNKLKPMRTPDVFFQMFHILQI